MNTRNTPCLVLGTFSEEVVKNRYLFSVMSGDRCPLRGNQEIVICVAITDNVTVSGRVVTVVTIPLLDFIMIH